VSVALLRSFECPSNSFYSSGEGSEREWDGCVLMVESLTDRAIPEAQ